MVPTIRTLVHRTLLDPVLGRLPGVLRRAPLASKRVALTFDDGPDDLTPRYLELLDDLGVPATFFISGERAEARPELVREYLRRGHQIANHGFTHQRFTELSRKELIEHLDRTEVAIGGQVTGRAWVRPPHGDLDPFTLLTLRSRGDIVALWSVDSLDHHERDPGKLADRCSPARIMGGDVILLHEGQPWTLQALPRIVAGLLASGLECVTMHDLFAR